MIELRGITWDHARGYDPLLIAADIFQKNVPTVSITWKKRSLEEFGDFPVNILAETFDLIMVDHPFSGEAEKHNIFLALDNYLSKSEIESRRNQSVGHSFDSYVYNNKIMALACDAAAQVSAYVIAKIQKEDLPATWEALEYFAKHNTIAVPLCAVDMWCVFLTLSAQLSQGNVFSDTGLNVSVANEAIDMIYKLIDISDVQSIHSNPIEVLESMKLNQNIVYSPFLFGYTNYSRGNNNAHIRFSNVFSISEVPISLLGGVGIAVSARSQHKEVAVDFAKFVTDSVFQENEYFAHSGQPASLSAWCSESNNKTCNYFFKDTLSSLKNAYVRPRIPKFNEFQEQVSKLLHINVQKGEKGKDIVNDMNSLYHKKLRSDD